MASIYQGVGKDSEASRYSRDLKNELTSSQTTLSQLASMLTTRSARTQASTLQKQISAAQTTLSQLTSILPP
jgi:hypothetical protein